MNDHALVKRIINRFQSGVFKMLRANVLNKVISMLSNMVITRLLTQNDYGIWSYALNIYSYLALITGLGLISGAMQFGSENKGQARAYSYYKYCFEKGLLFDIGLIIVAGMVFLHIELPIANAKPFVIAVFPLLLIEFVFSMGQTILRSKNRIREYANTTNINTILITIGTCCGALLGVKGVVVGRFAGNAFTLVYLYQALSPEIKIIKLADELQPIELHSLWHYSLFTGASAALNVLVYSLDITLIAALIKDPSEVSIYKVGTLIPNSLQFIPQSIVVAILPSIIYHKKDLSWIRRNLKRTYFYLTTANIALTIFLVLCAPIIIRIISGEKYMASVPVLKILSLGYFFSGTFRTLSVNVLAAFRRVYYGLFISISSCVTDIVFNYLLIHRYQTVGAAYATLLVDVVTAVLSFGYVLYLLKRGTINGRD